MDNKSADYNTQVSRNEEYGKHYKEYSRKNKFSIGKFLICVTIIVGILGGMYYYIEHTNKSQFELEKDALEGWLPGKSQEDIEAELNRIIDKSRFNVAINPMTVVSRYKIANFMIENVPANNYWMQVSVYYQDNNGVEQLLYESKLIQQGYFIEKAEVTHLPDAGEYNGRAIFKAIIPESDEVMGQTIVTMAIYVEEE